MDSNGTILWKRKYYTHRRSQNDTYSSDLVLNKNDEIFITGFANNLYDTTDMEWDILVIAADKNGCIDKNDCENFYTATTKEIITPYKIPFVLYPNPSAEDFFVLLSQPALPSTEVNIFNVEGKNIYSYHVEPGVLDIHIQNFKAAKGEYILEVKDKRGLVGSKKLVRE